MITSKSRCEYLRAVLPAFPSTVFSNRQMISSSSRQPARLDVPRRRNGARLATSRGRHRGHLHGQRGGREDEGGGAREEGADAGAPPQGEGRRVQEAGAEGQGRDEGRQGRDEGRQGRDEGRRQGCQGRDEGRQGRDEVRRQGRDEGGAEAPLEARDGAQRRDAHPLEARGGTEGREGVHRQVEAGAEGPERLSPPAETRAGVGRRPRPAAGGAARGRRQRRDGAARVRAHGVGEDRRRRPPPAGPRRRAHGRHGGQGPGPLGPCHLPPEPPGREPGDGSAAEKVLGAARPERGGPPRGGAADRARQHDHRLALGPPRRRLLLARLGRAEPRGARAEDQDPVPGGAGAGCQHRHRFQRLRRQDCEAVGPGRRRTGLCEALVCYLNILLDKVE